MRYPQDRNTIKHNRRQRKIKQKIKLSGKTTKTIYRRGGNEYVMTSFSVNNYFNICLVMLLLDKRLRTKST